MVMNLESFGVDDVGYDETETEPRAKFDKFTRTGSEDLVSGHSLADCTFPA
jgi:hypothetical protein